MSDRLIHDAAFDLSRKLVEVIRPCIRDEEVREAAAEFYGLAKECLRKYADAVESERRMMHPLDGR
jgi:hypothetical protein